MKPNCGCLSWARHLLQIPWLRDVPLPPIFLLHHAQTIFMLPFITGHLVPAGLVPPLLWRAERQPRPTVFVPLRNTLDFCSTPILLRPHRSICPVASRGPTARGCARELPKAKTPHSSFWTSRLETRHCSTWCGVPAGQPEVQPNSLKFLFPPIVQKP